jgi:hypothetical protein
MADYNINAVTRRVVYTGSAGVGPYAFSFEVLAATDIAVYKNATKLTLTTNYTVTINANGTGSITLTSAATGSDKITIIGARAIERTTDFVTAGDLLAASLNEQLDSQIVMIQQLAEENKRTMKAPQYDPASSEDGGTLNMTLPTAASRAGNILAFDNSGNPIATEAIGEWRGNWATTTSYAKRDLVKDTSNSNVYVCVTAHTSTGSEPISSNADVAKWAILVDAAAASSASSSASTSATNAAASASAASSSASSASGSASSASTSASNAASAQAAAESARDATLASFDSFDDRYLGSKTGDPSVDNDGNALAAGSLYFDSTNGIMKVYTGSAWVAAYVSGADFLPTSGGSMNGSLTVGVSSSGNAVRITQTGTGNALLVEDSANPDATPFVVDANGYVIQGYTAAVGTTPFQQNLTSASVFQNWSRWWNGSAGGPQTSFQRSRSGTIGSYSVVLSGDQLGTLNFNGDDGSAFITAASISSSVDATPGTNDMPGRLVFSTTADGASTPTERLRIGSAGQFGIAGANYGTAGQVLTSGGSGAAPSWTAPGAPSGSLLAAPYNVYATTAASGTGTVATITFTPATTIPVGSILRISGMTPSGYNGTYTVTASSDGSVSFASSTTGSQTVAGSFFVTPSGYLYCDGSIYTRSAYPTLAGIIGTPFVASTQTTNYTNASFIISGGLWSEQDQSLQRGVWDANGFLFTNGTALRGSDQATGLASAMLYSTDGVNWTAATSYSILATHPNQDAVVFGNSIYVMAAGNLAASGGGNNIQYASTPGGTWTRASVGVISRSGTGCLAFGGTANTFLVGLWNDSCGSRSWLQYYHSTNGSTWTALPTVANFNGYEPVGIAAYSGGAVIGTSAGSGTSNLWYSATGNSGYTNISASIGSPLNVYNVSYGNSIFVVRASNGTWTSTTGAGGSWTQVSTVDLGASVRYSPLHWSGTAWVDSATGRYTKDFINYGSASSTLAATAVLSGRAYNKVNKTISSYDFNAYTTATQFPVPAITNTVSTSAALLESGTPSFGYFIKT